MPKSPKGCAARAPRRKLYSMQPFGITQTGPDSFHIQGFPDGVKVVTVDGAVARRLGHLALHRSDLEFVCLCLDAMEQLPQDQEGIRTALWTSAVVHYVKCFGDSKKRFQLDPTQVHRGCSPETRQAFEFFKSLRNKHIVHDENGYKQSTVGAIINAGNKPFKIEKVVAMTFTFQVHGPENRRNLRLLTQRALGWVAAQFDECAGLVSAQLETIRYDELAARPAIQTHGPTVDDMHKPRP